MIRLYWESWVTNHVGDGLQSSPIHLINSQFICDCSHFFNITFVYWWGTANPLNFQMSSLISWAQGTVGFKKGQRLWICDVTLDIGELILQSVPMLCPVILWKLFMKSTLLPFSLHAASRSAKREGLGFNCSQAQWSKEAGTQAIGEIICRESSSSSCRCSILVSTGITFRPCWMYFIGAVGLWQCSTVRHM